MLQCPTQYLHAVAGLYYPAMSTTSNIIIFAIALFLAIGLVGLIYSMLWAVFNAVFQAKDSHCDGHKKQRCEPRKHRKNA